MRLPVGQRHASGFGPHQQVTNLDRVQLERIAERQQVPEMGLMRH